MKRFSNFYWYVIMAVCAIFLTACYMWEGKFIISVLWAVVGGCDIAMAWLNRNE